MAILVSIDTAKAYEVAEQFESDTSLSEALRYDMFQIKLLSQTNPQKRAALAVETLKQKDPARGKLVLHSLVNDDSWGLHLLRERIYLTLPSTPSSSRNLRQLQKLPPELDTSLIMPLLNDENEETAAYAGYVAVLLGEVSGMEPLLKYWRELSGDSVMENDFISVLVCRAIAAMNDEQYIPILREIYSNLETYEVGDFYWAIRSMTGPEILKFRKEIRDKHGMENLR